MASAAVLIASFNRRDTTTRCLRQLAGQAGTSVDLQVVVVDDASTDGTSEAVESEFPETRLIRGSGELYWSAAMALAWSVAAELDPDYYVLLNDDVDLRPRAIENLIRLAQDTGDRPTIWVAAMADPRSGKTTYGGHRLTSRWNPMAFETVEPDRTRSIAVDLCSGNCVLVPRSVFHVLGTIDPVYRHGIGDFDYARRAASMGVDIRLAPGHYGTCSLNPPIEHTFREYVTSFKSHRYPPDWIRYCWRHGNRWALPVAVPGPYAKAAWRALRGKPIVTT